MIFIKGMILLVIPFFIFKQKFVITVLGSAKNLCSSLVAFYPVCLIGSEASDIKKGAECET